MPSDDEIQRAIDEYARAVNRAGALSKVNVPLSERYETKCVSCGWYRHFFGTATEARESALKMGWEFRFRLVGIAVGYDVAYCPHCKLLYPAKETPCPSSK